MHQTHAFSLQRFYSLAHATNSDGSNLHGLIIPLRASKGLPLLEAKHDRRFLALRVPGEFNYRPKDASAAVLTHEFAILNDGKPTSIARDQLLRNP